MPRRSLWSRVRQARLPRVLLIYLGAAWLMVQVADSLRDAFAWPAWVSQVVILLLAIGLLIITATAWVQSRPGAAERADREEIPGSWEVDLGDVRESVARGRLPHLTWARAILGGVIAFSLLFGLAGAWVLLGGRPGGAVPGERTMLAVLPFENLGATEDEYFADGLTEEITARLAGIQRLGLISRTSTLQYKNTTKPIPTIGEELGVEYVLEGTVRWQPASSGTRRVRVTPQLIRVEDDSHVWASVYDQSVTEIFDIQSDIAGQVVNALDLHLGDPERRSLETRPTGNLAAYDAFLRANDLVYNYRKPEDIRLAVSLLDEAVELDPGFALAWARLSRAHTNLYHFSVDRTQARLALARRAADESLRLQPDLADAHVALGYWHYQGQLDYDRALEELKIARGLQPSSVDAIQAMGFVQRRQGRFDDALENIREAARLDPRSGTATREVAVTLFVLGRYDQAGEVLERSLALGPGNVHGLLYGVLLPLARNDLEGARRAAERGLSEGGRSFAGRLAPTTGAALYARILGEDALDDLLELAPADFQRDSVEYWLTLADVHRFRGSHELQHAFADSARALLERKLVGEPDEPSFHSDLGFAYFLLGEEESALREARRGADLRPFSKDALSEALWPLALMLARLGDSEAAVAELEKLVSRPGQTTVGFLRLHPELEPLRANARFRRLIEEHAWEAQGA